MLCHRRRSKWRIIIFSICTLILTAIFLISYGEKFGGNTGVIKYEGSANIVWMFESDSYIQKKASLEKNPYSRHAFNVHVSDNIPVDRELPDPRHINQCDEKMRLHKFLKAKVSVIISFHNEARSALLRTIVSVLNRSPSNLLQEIVLIDDFSDDETDGEELAVLPKVKLYRNSRREGLIRSRSFGADMATGDCVVFLDSHCEVNVNWLEPLVADVLQNPDSLISPVIDIVDQDSFEYKASSGNLKGGFDWGLNFHWLPLTEEEKAKRSPVQPFKSPVLPGGLLLAKKSWYEKIGGFDKGLEIWGAENIEISLKTWLCGGEVLVEPCSRVGHIFRNRHPYTFPENASASVYMRNVRRVAEAWLDEYQHEFFEAVPKAKKEILTKLDEQKNVKDYLKCKPFRWFLQEVYPELKPIVKDILAFGQVRQGDLCLQRKNNRPANQSVFQLISCVMSSKQDWIFSRNGYLQLNDTCLTADINSTPQVVLDKCSDSINQKWIRRKRLLQHKNSGLCLESSTNYQNPTLLVLSPCYRKSYTQQWDFSMELQVWDS